MGSLEEEVKFTREGRLGTVGRKSVQVVMSFIC